MMAEITKLPFGTGTRVAVPPELFKVAQAKISAIIEMAARLKDWPLLERAIDEKIRQQIDFCIWWRENVRGAGNPAIVSEPKQFMSVEDTSRLTGITKLQQHRWKQWLGMKDNHPDGDAEEIERYRRRIWLVVCRAAGLELKENYLAGTGEDEWFTPRDYIEAARAVLGEIDLDPASHPHAQEWIKAKRFFTPEDDGLHQEWHGRIWLNPPFSRDKIGKFFDKFVAEVAAGHVTAGIVLTHNNTDTQWFHNGARVSTAWAFTLGRIGFVDMYGTLAAPTQGQTFFYCGPEVERFVARFRELGLAYALD